MPVGVLLGLGLVFLGGDLFVAHPAAVMLDVPEVAPGRLIVRIEMERP